MVYIVILISYEGKKTTQKVVHVQSYSGFPCKAEGARAATRQITIEQGRTTHHIPIVSLSAVVLAGEFKRCIVLVGGQSDGFFTLNYHQRLLDPINKTGWTIVQVFSCRHCDMARHKLFK